MTPERYRQIGELYHAALELEPIRRAAFLDEACQGDDELSGEIRRLLASNEEAGSFLAAPVLQTAAQLIAEDQADAMIGRRLGRYRILSRIGAGGMGEVYLAEDERLGRRIALKLLPAEFAANPERLRRFEREARAASATDHPNIVTIHEIGEAEGVHFIAGEFVEGETVRRLIEREALPPLDALDIALQVADALSAAHAAGIVHRDIKPENIMLRPDGYVKVLDFGLAAITQSQLPATGDDSDAPTIPTDTAPGTILGTVSYMSPEQTRGQKLDARSDLWSLGVVLYEMLTQRKPFPGESMPDIFVAILDRQPPPLSQSISNPAAQSAGLERILTMLLAKSRDQRYPSAMQLTADLKKLHHRLELEAELAHTKSDPAANVIKPSAITHEPNTASSPTIITQSPLSATSPGEPAVIAAAATRPSRAPAIIIAALAVALTIALVSAAGWWWLHPKSPAALSTATTEQLPERWFSYSLTVQKVRDGSPYQTPFQSSGRDIYENGWKFRLNFSSPQSGFLYLINEGPTQGGAISYTLLFPLPSIKEASAQIESNEPMQTGWYEFNEFPGIEKFWIVWAAHPIGELETIKTVVLNSQDKGSIGNPRQRDTVRTLLARVTETHPVEDRVKKQTLVSGHGDILIYLAELEHH
ncbi:MAG: protein kinase [Acidobacteriota bacterium]